MKNKFLIILFFLKIASNVYAEEIKIEAKDITLDKKNFTSIFENEVVIKTEDNNTIESDYLEYNKKKGLLKLKNNITANDVKNNVIKTDRAEYNEKEKIFLSIGETEIITSEKYILKGADIKVDNKKNIISSKNQTLLKDPDGNQIYLENFEFNINSNIFKSIGFVKIQDKMNNIYEFSQIYIDTKKKEILGTDIKAFLNQEDFKVDQRNKPRVFANSIKIEKNSSSFNKSIFTLCDYRKDDKCPPWTIQSSQMLHDSKKKTIYYDNAVIKVYDIPIFYFPKLAHPDPTVDRRSGFLPPSLYDTKNLGEGISIPYFLDLGIDRNLILTSRLYVSENPLMMGEYHQVFKDSSFLTDFGFTEGYKKTSVTKKSGNKSHIFAKFVKNFTGKEGSENSLNISVQNVSNDKYLKLYKIKSNLVDYNKGTLESSLEFTHETDDIFFGMNASIYETLKDNYTDKYEYIAPEIIFNKNLFNNDKFGSLDLQTNLKTHNYDTNKLTNFFVNDLNWRFKDINFNTGINTKILGNIKNINYEAKNVDIYKDEATSEIFGALGFLSQINLQKNVGDQNHLLTPKMFLRYSPGSMRKETSGSKLNPINAFSMDRLGNINNFETGASATLGLDYNIKDNFKEFDFSVAQVISQEENKKMASRTSLDEKLSDLVGSANYKFNNKFSLNYNFALDQNYNDINYNEIGTEFNIGIIDINFNYLQEKKHIGDQDYFTTELNLKNKDKGLLSFETKRNLITNSSEFYNLSYEYINDCLRAGLVYRREFYNDSELEPENSLMFKITLTPFGGLESPTFSK